MKREVFLCDGATPPPDWRGISNAPKILRTDGSGANVRLQLEWIHSALATTTDDRARDLVRIAAFCYAADQSVSRGGTTDVYLHDWQRDMHVAVTVQEAWFWSSASVSQSLSDALGFVSDDRWTFHFEEAPPRPDPGPSASKLPLDRSPNAVVLLSGGLDSAAAALSACMLENARPVLVSQRPSAVVAAHQTAVAGSLRRLIHGWYFPHFAPWINRSGGGEPAEVTQRTRSFLFAALGAMVATGLGIHDIRLADNGVVSLNIPVNAQLVGARASRSTHPKFIWLFNRLLQALWPQGAPIVTNPLLLKTREECVQLIRDLGDPALIRETVSCAHPYRRDVAQQHCGMCSQCIGRRFATVAANSEDADPAGGYEVDIFGDELPVGDGMTTVVSFVRFAAEVKSLSTERLWERYPAFADCIMPDDKQSGQSADALVAMLKRHAEAVDRVMLRQVERRREELAAGRLPPRSLVSIIQPAIAPQPAADSLDFQHDSVYRNITFRGTRYSLTEREAQIVQRLHEAWRGSAPEVSFSELRRLLDLPTTARVGDVFGRGRRNGSLFCRGDSLIVKGGRKDLVRLNLAASPSSSDTGKPDRAA